MTTYKTGTISVGSGSTTLTGAGTSWLTAGVQAGDKLHASGLTVYIAAVNSATSITLARAWPGATLSAVDYDIEYVDDDVRALTATNLLLQALTGGTLTSLSGLAGGADKLPYFTGLGTMAQTDLTSAARTLLGSSILSRSGDNLVTTTAARLTGGAVQSGPTDATAGRLMPVGAFGLGAATGVGIPGDNANSATVGGLYRMTGSTANNPTAATATLIVNRSYDVITQTASASPTSNYSRRSVDGGATWAAWDAVAGKILGTVSQSGGVPTGAVIERGSNANGEYVRFADGTQICTRSILIATASATATADFAFPAAFFGTPHFSAININFEIGGPDVAARSALNSTRSVTTKPGLWRVRFRDYASGDVGSLAFLLFAFGRWY